MTSDRRIGARTRNLLAVLWLTANAIGCMEDADETRRRVFAVQRQDAFNRCLAHGALENYKRQCEQIGGHILVVRHTYVCFGKDDERNPNALGDGPYCVCPKRDGEGRCVGEADCDGGVREKCEPLLAADVVPFYRPDGKTPIATEAAPR